MIPALFSPLEHEDAFLGAMGAALVCLILFGTLSIGLFRTRAGLALAALALVLGLGLAIVGLADARPSLWAPSVVLVALSAALIGVFGLERRTSMERLLSPHALRPLVTALLCSADLLLAAAWVLGLLAIGSVDLEGGRIRVLAFAAGVAAIPLVWFAVTHYVLEDYSWLAAALGAFYVDGVRVRHRHTALTDTFGSFPWNDLPDRLRPAELASMRARVRGLASLTKWFRASGMLSVLWVTWGALAIVLGSSRLVDLTFEGPVRWEWLGGVVGLWLSTAALIGVMWPIVLHAIWLVHRAVPSTAWDGVPEAGRGTLLGLGLTAALALVLLGVSANDLASRPLLYAPCVRCNATSFGPPCLPCPAIVDGRPCSGHGSCSDDGTCDCDRGHFGDVCDVTCGSSNYSSEPCNGHGDCILGADGNATCFCTGMFTLPLCETACSGTIERGVACHGHGHCVSFFDLYEPGARAFYPSGLPILDQGNCVCKKGWGTTATAKDVTRTCEECQPGSREACSDHGVCVGTTLSATGERANVCRCDTGWIGAACETCPPTHAKFKLENGTTVCLACPNDGASACSGHGLCEPTNYKNVDATECLCVDDTYTPTGFTGADCQQACPGPASGAMARMACFVPNLTKGMSSDPASCQPRTSSGPPFCECEGSVKNTTGTFYPCGGHQTLVPSPPYESTDWNASIGAYYPSADDDYPTYYAQTCQNFMPSLVGVNTTGIEPTAAGKTNFYGFQGDRATCTYTCVPGMAGPLCQQRRVACRNGGVYVNTFVNRCVCTAQGDVAFWGADCGEPCACNPEGSANAQCDGVTGQCECRHPAGGRACDETCPGTALNGSVECSGHGRCDGTTLACACDDGWAGDACDRCVPGTSAGCGGHGKCQADGGCVCSNPSWDASSRCAACVHPGLDRSKDCLDCVPGFYGPTCDEQCATMVETPVGLLPGAPCSDGVGGTGARTGACYPAFYGPNCTGLCDGFALLSPVYRLSPTLLFHPDQESLGGVLVDLTLRGVVPFAEWNVTRTGASAWSVVYEGQTRTTGAEVSAPTAIACEGHGTCGLDGPGCTCIDPYVGANCTSNCPVAGGNRLATPCSGHGTCDATTLKCVCSPTWRGGACEHECPGSDAGPPVTVCGGWGDCTDDGTCECAAGAGAAGGSCEKCPGTTGNRPQQICSGHGSCVGGRCACFFGWYDSACSSKSNGV